MPEELLCGQQFGGPCPNRHGHGDHICDKPDGHSGSHSCSFCGTSG